MTKEEILDAEDEHLVIKAGVEIVVRNAALSAMSIYAKEMAIGFGEWILKESILPRDTHWFDAGKHPTTEQLYQLFLKSLE